MVSLTSERGKGISKLIISEDLARKNVFVQAWVLTAVHLHMKADLQLTLLARNSFFLSNNEPIQLLYGNYTIKSYLGRDN